MPGGVKSCAYKKNNRGQGRTEGLGGGGGRPLRALDDVPRLILRQSHPQAAAVGGAMATP